MSTTDPMLLQGIDHLDFPTPCAWAAGVGIVRRGVVNEPCENPPAWEMTCRRCGKHAPVCNEHRRAVLAEDISTCKCGNTGRPARAFSFYPIGGDR